MRTHIRENTLNGCAFRAVFTLLSSKSSIGVRRGQVVICIVVIIIA